MARRRGQGGKPALPPSARAQGAGRRARSAPVGQSAGGRAASPAMAPLSPGAGAPRRPTPGAAPSTSLVGWCLEPALPPPHLSIYSHCFHHTYPFIPTASQVSLLFHVLLNGRGPPVRSGELSEIARTGTPA
uniref:Uncharacterized protein n=1 Tax=Terrapene triunguis TaxID=2587831 RepID=A0A674IR19_9SAUR